MVKINYMQEIRSLEERFNLRFERLENKIESTFDHFTMMVQRQFLELIKASEETKTDIAELKKGVSDLKTIAIRQEVTLVEFKDISRELKEISKNHENRIVKLEEVMPV